MKVAEHFAIISHTSDWPKSSAIVEEKKYLGHYTLATAIRKIDEKLTPSGFIRYHTPLRGCGYKWVDEKGNCATLVPCYRKF